MDKDGTYCNVCGGISPSKVTIKRIIIDEKGVGINELDRTIDKVRKMGLRNDDDIADALLRYTKEHNYVPTNRTREYSEALMREYKRTEE
jgi:hypothetical protein